MRNTAYNRGFTLLEMIVALAIFTVVAVFAVGSLVRITSLNKSAQTLQASMSNLSYGLESMSREMRVGTNFNCQDYSSSQSTVLAANSNNSPLQGNMDAAQCKMDNIPTSGSNQTRVIAFQSSKIDSSPVCSKNYHLAIAYAFVWDDLKSRWSLQKAQQNTCNDGIFISGANKNFYPVLDEINMQLTGYALAAFRPSSNSQPNYSWVFIRLIGSSGVREKEKNTFDVQTSVSERIAI